MSKKVSAFQVYSEEQTHQRHSRSYRAHSPPTQSGRLAGMDWRDSLKGSAGRSSVAAHSPSPEGRGDRSYVYDSYDSRRDDHHTAARDRVTSYRDDGRHGDKDSQAVVVASGTRYRSDGQYERYSWEDRRDDYTTTTTTTRERDRVGHSHKDDYLSVSAQRQVSASNAPASYSDSDEECLHENLRRKKTTINQFSTEVVDDRRWSSDDDNNDYNNYRQARKRALSGASYHSHSPEQSKDWREAHFSTQQHDPHPPRSYSPESDRDYLHSPPTKKKKAKSGKKASKVKDKKQKAVVALAEQQPPPVVVPASTGKIQSLMDVKIPSSVKKQVELASSSTATVISKFGEGRPEYKFNANSEDSTGRSLPRSSSNHGDSRTTSTRYDDAAAGSRNRSHYDDYYHQDSHRSREAAFGGGRRDSESDRHGNHHHHHHTSHSHKDSYSSRHSPDHSHRSSYHHDDYDRGGGRDRQRRSSFSRGDGRGNGDSSKRKRPSSLERRDWPRSGARTSQRERDRSPDYSSYSDSDQDSERGGRRSWRDERRERDRQPKKKDDDRDRGQKGDKKSKTKVEVAPKSSQRSKKSTTTTSNTTTTTTTTTSKKETPKDPESSSRMEVLPCKDGLAVFLTHPQTVCLRGRAKLWVFAGEVKVMGYPLQAKSSQSYDLFSLSTASLVTINTVSAEKEKKVLRKAIQGLGVEEKLIKDFMMGSGVVVLMASRLDFPAADYICTHPPFTQLFRYNFDRAPLLPTPVAPPSPETGKVGAAFLATEQATVMFLKESQEFEAALNKWSAAVKSDKTPSPVGLLCGGVNSGKSTFSRYMVNASLACVPRVCYLDCDVGQTEFSPPGTIALTVLDSPIFGPPFCHQKIPERMCFYGLVNPAEGPNYYIQCVEYVLEAYKQMDSPPPLVVNTMGWNKDVGLHLFLDVLYLVSPDLVVQFSLSSDVLNFPPITPHFVARQPGWIYNTELGVEEEEGEDGEKKSEAAARKPHEHVTIQSLVSSRNDPTRVKLTSKNLRDLALLGHMMLGFGAGVTLASAPPYTVPWGRMGLYVHHGHSLATSTIDALRAGIVALCRADLSQAFQVGDDSPLMFKEPPVCECFGYGLVREVCHESCTLKVVTAMSGERLAQVNTLIRGTVSTPDQLPLKQGHMEDVPFIDALEPAMALAPVRPRTRMPRRSRI